MPDNNFTSYVKHVSIVLPAVLLLVQPVYGQTYAKWLAPPEMSNIKNPVGADDVNLRSARKLYISLCSPCHGYKGLGDGPVAGTIKPRPADHSSAEVQGETDGSLFWKVTTGRGPMRSYKAELTDSQRWELVNYIRTLRK